MRKLSVLLILVLMVSMVAGVSAAPRPPMTAKGQVDGSTVRLPEPLTPGTLWANGSWDDVNGLASELNTAVPDARTADDFQLGCDCSLYDITQIRASHMSSSAPPNAQVEVYQDSGGSGPGTLIGTYAMTSSAPLGYSQYGWPVIEYTFNTPGLQVPCGHYWVSAIGLGDGSYGDRSFFATTGNGVVMNQEGYFLSSYFGFTTWTPGTGVYGYYTDYAFDVDGNCVEECSKHLFKTRMDWGFLTRPGWCREAFSGIVHDQTHVWNDGATVTGFWTVNGVPEAPVTFVTANGGLFKFPRRGPCVSGDVYTFRVTDIVHGGCLYDPASNHQTPTRTVIIP